jgi:hypothetical protein
MLRAPWLDRSLCLMSQLDQETVRRQQVVCSESDGPGPCLPAQVWSSACRSWSAFQGQSAIPASGARSLAGLQVSSSRSSRTYAIRQCRAGHSTSTGSSGGTRDNAAGSDPASGSDWKDWWTYPACAWTRRICRSAYEWPCCCSTSRSCTCSAQRRNPSRPTYSGSSTRSRWIRRTRTRRFERHAFRSDCGLRLLALRVSHDVIRSSCCICC